MWRDNGLNHLALTAPTLRRSDAMQTSNPDRPVYDTGIVDLDPEPDAIEGFLTDAGELVPSGAQGLPRVRISWEAFAKGGYKREATVEFPAIDVTCGEGWEIADETLDAVDRLSRAHVARMERRDAARQESGGA